MCSVHKVSLSLRTFHEKHLYVNGNAYDYTPKNENDLVSNRHFDDFNFFLQRKKSIFFVSFSFVIFMFFYKHSIWKFLWIEMIISIMMVG